MLTDFVSRYPWSLTMTAAVAVAYVASVVVRVMVEFADPTMLGLDDEEMKKAGDQPEG